MPRTRLYPIPEELEPLTQKIEAFAGRCFGQQSFMDFLEVSAISISNSVDRESYEERQARYLSIIRRYRTDADRAMFAELLNDVKMLLGSTGKDVLGPISDALGIAQGSSQRWTNWDDCMKMSSIVISRDMVPNNDLAATIHKYGFAKFYKENCGPGTTVLAMAKVFENAGYSSQTQLHFDVIDTTVWFTHMAYIQISLMGIPAIVMFGHEPTHTIREIWLTPQHVTSGWGDRLQRLMAESDRDDDLNDYAPNPSIQVGPDVRQLHLPFVR